MPEKHTYQDIKKPYVFQPYPKIKYRAAVEGEEGDLKSPAYEKIAMVDGVAQRVPEHHSYITIKVHDEDAEKELGPEWVDHPLEIGKSRKVAPAVETPAEPEKRGPGRPRKQPETIE